MQHNTDFAVRYLTTDPVPIRDIIGSLQAVETILGETTKLLPELIPGLQIQKVDIRVREISQNSPLRELFAIGLFVAFQKQLEAEVPQVITDATGVIIPDRFDTIVTVLAMIVVFYGASALKDFVVGRGNEGSAKVQLDALIAELASDLGVSERTIRDRLEARYGEKTLWKRLINGTSRFFAPSKHQDSAAVEVNGRQISQDVVREVPAEYLVEDISDERPARTFENVEIELHAQDRDHTGRGWAAIVNAVSGQRLKMKLMDEVSANELWRKDKIVGDVTVLFDRIGSDLVPREVHLHRVRSGS